MSNPYTSPNDIKNNVKLNVWDWSHEFHFTSEIGRILPCFTARLGAKQSLSISATHAEQFMPMMFPIQSRIRARMSFFKMPIRALWKNYVDYISSVNQVDSSGNPLISKYIPPFISISSGTSDNSTANKLFDNFNRYFGTGSNLDYMDVPTTFDDVSSTMPLPCVKTVFANDLATGTVINMGTSCLGSWPPGSTPDYLSRTLTVYPFKKTYKEGDKITIDFSQPVGTSSGSFFLVALSNSLSPSIINIFIADNSDSVSYPRTSVDFICPSEFSVNPGESLHLFFSYEDIYSQFKNSPDFFKDGFQEKFISISNTYGPRSCPWYDVITGKGLKLSSLPLRMFEACYNAYFRNDKNNPLSVGGVKKYNDWVLCRDKDGDDSVNYDGLQIDGEESSLEYFYGPKYCNWEPDMFTTCVPSPQEGRPPLVGLTNYLSTSEVDGIMTTRVNSVLTDEDGVSYNVNLEADADGINNISYTRTVEDANAGVPINLSYAAVTQGISIEDFRQVNAYQRYLELNMRRGYSYKDIIEGRFDVKLRYNELLMPEFCGGFTRDMNMRPVTQTTPTDESGTYQGSLGSQAGQGFISGENQGNINIFCDEDSIVMGFLVVYPDPVYTQHLPKFYLDRDPLDSFNPEFANIGFQPITLAEVAPIQAFNNSASLTETFGYQRPWYDMLSRVNTAHGLFRTQLRNFLMYRRFSGVPRLTKDFLIVRPDQVNDVFSVTEVTDKLFGMIKFDIRVKNAVPRNNVPKIE